VVGADDEVNATTEDRAANFGTLRLVFPCASNFDGAKKFDFEPVEDRRSAAQSVRIALRRAHDMGRASGGGVCLIHRAKPSRIER